MDLSKWNASRCQAPQRVDSVWVAVMGTGVAERERPSEP